MIERLVLEALDTATSEKEVAAIVRRDLDKMIGKTWNVVVSIPMLWSFYHSCLRLASSYLHYIPLTFRLVAILVVMSPMNPRNTSIFSMVTSMSWFGSLVELPNCSRAEAHHHQEYPELKYGRLHVSYSIAVQNSDVSARLGWNGGKPLTPRCRLSSASHRWRMSNHESDFTLLNNSIFMPNLDEGRVFNKHFCNVKKVALLARMIRIAAFMNNRSI